MSPNPASDPSSKPKPVRSSCLRSHSLGLGALAIVVTLIVAYVNSDPSTHLGSFCGNAIADWPGVLVTVIATNHLYEKGSAESKQPRGKLQSPTLESLREHSLTVFLVTTWFVWIENLSAYGSEQPLGTRGRQYRLRVDPDFGSGMDDQDPDGGWIKRGGSGGDGTEAAGGGRAEAELERVGWRRNLDTVDEHLDPVVLPVEATVPGQHRQGNAAVQAGIELRRATRRIRLSPNGHYEKCKKSRENDWLSAREVEP